MYGEACFRMTKSIKMTNLKFSKLTLPVCGNVFLSISLQSVIFLSFLFILPLTRIFLGSRFKKSSLSSCVSSFLHFSSQISSVSIFYIFLSFFLRIVYLLRWIICTVISLQYFLTFSFFFIIIISIFFIYNHILLFFSASSLFFIFVLVIFYPSLFTFH